MKSLEYVIEHITEIEHDNFTNGRFSMRLSDFCTLEQMKKIGISYKDPEDEKKHKPKEWTKENIIAQLKEDVDFGFEKALNQRGISSNLMYNVVLTWDRILEDGLEDYPEDEYAYYGLPLFKANALKYGFDNPIGSDSGTELMYNG